MINKVNETAVQPLYNRCSSTQFKNIDAPQTLA